jgi:4,5:9,10-diseco-3-hydroxy-5,9,17-trioxoandrosta-1(10),2-diene-4-oate hydrolase
MERRLTIDDSVLVLDDEGVGDAIVCLHAIGHDASDFARLRARLRDRWRVIAIDWPGQGRSPREAAAPSATRYATLVAGVLDALEVSSCVLVGNSIGGATAIAHAAAHPERVRGLVLENPGGLAPVDDRLAQTVLAAMAGFFAAGRRGAWWFPFAFGLYYRTVLQRGMAREARERIVARAGRSRRSSSRRGAASRRPESDLRAVAPRIHCPVLFAWAGRDQLVALPRSLPAIWTFPDARLVRFPAGHAPHLETPDAFEAALETFLAELPAPASASRRAAP